MNHDTGDHAKPKQHQDNFAMTRIAYKRNITDTAHEPELDDI